MDLVLTASLPTEQEYLKLFKTTGWNKDYNLTSEELFKSIQNSSYCVSAYDEDKLVGFGRMLSDGVAHAVLFDVIVLPEFQGESIGREITEKLLEVCRSNKIRDIQLFCAIGKIGFYEKLGFKKRSDECPGMEIIIRY